MKQFILVALVISFLYSCTSTSEEASAAKLRAENLVLAHKFLDAVEAGDVETVSSLLADDYKGYGPSVNDSVTKEEAIQGLRYNKDSLYESVKYSRFQNVAATVRDGQESEHGDWVTDWAYLTIKYKDGRGPVNVWVSAVYKIKDGKIAMSKTFYNEADVLRQLGYEFVSPQEK